MLYHLCYVFVLLSGTFAVAQIKEPMSKIETLQSEVIVLLKERSSDPNKILIALEKLLEILEINEESVDAHALLSEVYTLMVGYGKINKTDGLARAKKHLTVANRLDSNNFYALKSSFRMALYSDLDVEKAFNLLTLVDKSHNEKIYTSRARADIYFYRGLYEKGFKELSSASKLNEATISNALYSYYYYYSGNFKLSIEYGEKALSQNPNHKNAKKYLARAFSQLEEYQKAIELWKELEADSTQNLSLKGEYLACLALSGEEKIAKNELKNFGSKLPNYRLAQIYASLAEDEKALKTLEKALGEKDPFLLWVKMDPLFKNLRQHKRFKDIAVKLGLEDEK